MLDSALDPVVSDALSKPDPEKALLNLKICDPACGSGHFLIAAAERIAKHLARLRTGDDEPSLTAIQHAKRDVIGRCIYGVDLNPMAVELCKVSLWMEALEPGKPLSFLDHHIQCGNSLLGATPALLKRGIPDAAFEPIEGDDKAACRDYRKQNRDERSRQTTMFDLFAKSEFIRLANVAPALARIETMGDDSIETLHAKEQAYREFTESTPYEFARLLANAWCAAFVIPKVIVPPLQPRVTLTESTFRKLENNPNVVPREVKDEIARLADRYHFFHWHLAFLNVFQPSRAEDIGDEESWAGTAASTSCWATRRGRRIKIQEQEWFAQRRPGHRQSTQRRRPAQDDPAARRGGPRPLCGVPGGPRRGRRREPHRPRLRPISLLRAGRREHLHAFRRAGPPAHRAGRPGRLHRPAPVSSTTTRRSSSSRT